MGDWDPGAYLRFDDERTRPCLDLVSHIAIEDPLSVVDLGCGPGNSTHVLVGRWPSAQVTGLDSSTSMIETARSSYPDQEWVCGSIETWHPAQPVDLVFSNAALQWLPDHTPLVKRLFSAVAPGGALAFQVPSRDFALVWTLICDVARDGPWAAQMVEPLGAITLEAPDFYYDQLAARARRLDIWETAYCHVLDSPQAVVDFMSSTGLRPFLDALPTERESERFVDALSARVEAAYVVRDDGRVLFPFKRTFVVAYA